MSQRERIIEQAAAMFAEQGIKSIRMDDIAHSLGMSKRTLYEMFDDKEELLYLSIRHMQQQRLEKVRALLQENLDDLSYIFEGVSMMMENKELHNRIFTNLNKFYPATFERVRKEAEEKSGETLYALINNYIRCGLILPNVDVRLSVTILYYTTTSIALSAGNMSLPNGVTFEDAMIYTIINFFRGIATIKGVQQIDAYFERKKQERLNSKSKN